MNKVALLISRDRETTESLRRFLSSRNLTARAIYNSMEILDLETYPVVDLLFLDPDFPIERADLLKIFTALLERSMLILLIKDSKSYKSNLLSSYPERSWILRVPFEKSDVDEILEDIDISLNNRYGSFLNFVGDSKPMLKLYDEIKKIAATDTSCIIYGETGTGKQLIAEAIHKLSKRRFGKFITLNSAAIPEDLLESELFGFERGAFTGAVSARRGKFEEADGGTLFLDEFGEISNRAQIRLLKIIEEKKLERLGSNRIIKVDIRLIFATNRNLKQMVESGYFREDLYHRINNFSITAPPLSARGEDIPKLASYFLHRANSTHGRNIKSMEKKLLDYLKGLSYKGNIRELKNMIEKAVIDADTDTDILTLSNFEYEYGNDDDETLLKDIDISTLSYKEMTRLALQKYEEEYFDAILTEFKGNISEAAKSAKIDRKTFYRKIKQLKIKADEYR